TWGAGLVLGALALAGLVVLTKVPVRVAAESTAAGFRPAGSALSTYLRQIKSTLFTLGPEVDDDVEVELFDQDHDLDDDNDDEAAAAKKPRARKPKVQAPKAEPVTDATQLDLELGPAVKGSPWKLPPPALLARS